MANEIYNNLKEVVKNYYYDCVQIIIDIAEEKNNTKKDILFYVDFEDDVKVVECKNKEVAFDEYGKNYSMVRKNLIVYRDMIIIINSKCQKTNYFADIYGYGNSEINDSDFNNFRKEFEKNLKGV
jgi:hypothetical protein